VKRTMLVSALVGALALPAAARAETFFTKNGAEKVTRDAASKRYRAYGLTYADTVARCRPQGDEPYDPRYKYDRWVCGWAGHDKRGELCSGALLIVGRPGPGAYTHRVLRGGRC
jgi:hypothetical protein